MLSWYVERVARQGQVAIATCTSEALVHPWGGRTAMLGTNPLAIGVPAHPRPAILDMSTGQVSMGKIIALANRGDALPSGWALDETGEPTTDPSAATRGSIAPFGGAKGYALGLLLEVLVATVTSTTTGRDVHGTLDATELATKGDVFIVIDQQDPAGTQSISDYLTSVRQTPPRSEHEPVHVPGDRTAARRSTSLRDGVEIPEKTLTELYSLLGRPRDEEDQT
jgi:LDH2 family malate/lactate/ureidoglycolate dehydrogenase